MRLMLVNAVFLILFLSCSIKSTEEKQVAQQPDEGSVYVFLGYKDRKPVFKAVRGVHKNSVWEFTPGEGVRQLAHYEDGYKPLSVHGDMIIYSVKGNLVVSKDRLPQNYNTIKAPRHVSVNDGVIYFSTQGEEGIKELQLQTGQIKRVSNDGYTPTVINNYLFYLKASSHGSGYVDVMRMDISNQDIRVLVEGIYEEGYAVLPSGNYLACQIPVEGDIVKAIYSIRDGKYHLIKNEELNEENYYPVYDYEQNGILYYKPEGLKTKFVPLPEEFNYVK